MRGFAMLLVVGCGGTGANVDAEGCDALESGSFTAITAGTTMDTTAPAVTIEGGFTITLPAGAVGFVSFDSTDDTEYALFADRPVAINAFTPSGTEIMASARATSTDVCTIVMRRDIIELTVGLFYLGLGPDTADINFVMRHFDPD